MLAFIAMRSTSAMRELAAASIPTGTPATWHAKLPARSSSKWRMPLRPSRSARANAGAPWALDATTPRPVTTTRSGPTLHHDSPQRAVRDERPVDQRKLDAGAQLAPAPRAAHGRDTDRLAGTDDAL